MFLDEYKNQYESEKLTTFQKKFFFTILKISE